MTNRSVIYMVQSVPCHQKYNFSSQSNHWSDSIQRDDPQVLTYGFAPQIKLNLKAHNVSRPDGTLIRYRFGNGQS